MVELADKQEKVDVVFMDPPRSGSDEKFLSSLVKLQPVFFSKSLSKPLLDPYASLKWAKKSGKN